MRESADGGIDSEREVERDVFALPEREVPYIGGGMHTV
jgi:hypothetical protein